MIGGSAADLTREVACVRRPDRRTTGADALGAFGANRIRSAAFAHNLPRVAASWDQPQLHRAGRHTAPQGRQRSGPPDPTSSASAQPLALG